MRTTALFAIGFSLLFGIGCGKSDKDAIQGAWVVESAERNGKQAAPEEIKDKKLVFTADKIMFEEGKEKKEESYKLDPNDKPGTIDVTVTIEYKSFGKVGGTIGGGKAPQIEPEEKVVKRETKTAKGIYSLEGGKLKLCLGDPDGERPSDFSSKGERMLIVLQRAK
jgi:uncharacterized protein (TIGR03067 family)